GCDCVKSQCGGSKLRIGKDRRAGEIGPYIFGESQIFAVALRPRKRGQPGNVAAWVCEALDKSSRDRIGSDAHNWLRRHCLGGSLSCASSKGEDDVDVAAGKFRRKGREFLHPSSSSSVLYKDSLPLRVSGFGQAFPECFAARRIC